MEAVLGVVAAIAGIGAFVWAAIFGGRGLADLVLALSKRVWHPNKGRFERRREVRRYVERVRRESAVLGASVIATNRKSSSAGVSPHFLLKLDDVYVPTMAIVPEAERVSDLIVSPQTGLLIRVDMNSTPIFPIFERRRFLVVLGPGGAGKTTLLRHLFLQATSARKLRETVHAKKTPVFISCVQAMRHIEAAPQGLENISVAAAALEAFLWREFFSADPLPKETELLRDAMRRGQLLVLFDGLDEILGITARAWLVRVIERISAEYADCSFVVTCRPAAYTSHARLGGEFSTIEIAPLNLAEVSRYIEAYSKSFGSADIGPDQRKVRHLRALGLVHELNLNPALAALVQNPLNLSILCHHAFVSGRDQIDYSEFLDACTLSLLGRWDLAKSVALAGFTNAAAVLEERSPQFRRAVVEIIAHSYATSPRGQQSEDELVAAVEAEIPGLREHEADQSGGRITARQLIRTLVLHGGILDEVGDRNYAFQSVVIRDYLEARFLVRTFAPADLASFVRTALDDTSRHRRAVFAVEHLSRQAPEHLDAIFAELAKEWKAKGVSVASIPMLEDLLATVELTAVSAHLVQSLQEILMREIRAETGDPRIRGRVGAAAALRGLYSIGDQFIPINDAEMKISAPGTDQEQIIPIGGFAINRYLVTNSDYEEFVRDGGYLERSHWTEAGWGWRAERSIERPFFWDVPALRNVLQPVVGVSWYEAHAFCTWKGVRLPSEVEWALAAGGPTCDHFPWGMELAPEQCNVAETEIGRPTIVGLFEDPMSAVPADLVGNVWEWTSSAYLPYPYDPADGREVASGDRPRVMKGGSWFSAHRQAASSYRRWLHPGARQPNFGFRLARSEASSAHD